MKSTKVKLITVPVLTGTLIVSGYAGIKYKLLEKENNQLKQELNKSNGVEENKVTYTTTVDDIKEINRKNADLIVYETKYTKYESEMTDDSFFGIGAKVNTSFKYDVTTDMSKANVDKIGNKIIVYINESDIILHDITVKRVNIIYDLNIFTQMRGKKIVDIESNMLIKTYDEIDRLVNKDYILNKELFKLRLIEKLERIYPSDVDVVII